MPIPSVDELKYPTLELLREGVTDTDEMRELLAGEFGLTDAQLGKKLKNQIPTFTNNHAWALVRLQQSKLIQKVGAKLYALTDAGRSFLETGADGPNYRVVAPLGGRMPPWAKTLINRANGKNGAGGPQFTEDNLVDLWRRCGGRCAVTRLEFSEEKVGTGAAKRAFAPSLDRIDPNGFYTLNNCRLVMVAVNFGMNAWGLEVYLKLAKAASEAVDNNDNNDDRIATGPRQSGDGIVATVR